MNKVLVVDDSQAQLEIFLLGLQEYKSKFKIITAANGEEAVAILKKEQISTLVTDLYMPKMDGLELLAYMTRNHPRIPCIVMTVYGSAEVQDILDQFGIFHYLEKPLDLKTLGSTILDALAQFRRGKSLDGLSVASFLQLVEMEEKSCIIEITSPKKETGSFIFVKGVLYNADHNNLDADQAAITMIGWANAKLRVKTLPLGVLDKKISFSLKALIMEGTIQGDINNAEEAETNKTASRANKVDILYHAVRRAEANEYKIAHQMLVTLLKQNARNSTAWLWYSRVTDKFQAVKIALENAKVLKKNDPEIIEESQKLQVALESGFLKVGEEIKHCPFCWTPFSDTPKICSYCKAYFLISCQMLQELQDKKKSVNIDILDKAIHRYTRIILVKKKHQVHFNLALAHINCGQLEIGLDQLYKTKELEPENKLYQQQLKILLDHMANVEVSLSSSESSKPQDIRTLAATTDQKDG